MPKILVLFHSRTGSTAALADAVAEGVRSVRFAEVTVRRLDDDASPEAVAAVPGWAEGRAALASRYQPLRGVEELAEHDALILGAPVRDGHVGAEVTRLLDQACPLQRRGALANTVGSAFTPTTDASGEPPLWSLHAPLARLGLILVPPAPADAAPASPAAAEQDLAAARQLGRRVAEVVGWVTHAKSHHHH
jgi:NAD(P)H dehydrogenase (quinone)